MMRSKTFSRYFSVCHIRRRSVFKRYDYFGSTTTWYDVALSFSFRTVSSSKGTQRLERASWPQTLSRRTDTPASSSGTLDFTASLRPSTTPNVGATRKAVAVDGTVGSVGGTTNNCTQKKAPATKDGPGGGVGGDTECPDMANDESLLFFSDRTLRGGPESSACVGKEVLFPLRTSLSDRTFRVKGPWVLTKLGTSHGGE